MVQSINFVDRRFRDFSRAKFQFEDDLFNTFSGSFVDTGVSIVPEAGINVIFFRANASSGAQGTAGASLQATYAGSEIGGSESNQSAQVGHWNDIELSGWKVIDCDGTSEVKLRALSTTGARSVDVGAQQLISLPLEGWGFVEDTHYFFQQDQGESVTEITESSPAIFRMDTFNVTVPTTGLYLVLWYAEGAQITQAALGEWVIYAAKDESLRSQHQARESTTLTDQFHTFAFSEIRTLDAGANDLNIQARRWNGVGAFKVKRSRIAVISMDAFQGTTQQITSFTDTLTTSNSFIERTEMAKTHNSGSRSEQVLVIANQTTEGQTSNNNVATYKIRDDTLGIDYAEDSGERMRDFASNVTSTMLFALKENANGNTDWKVFLRNANNTGSNVKVTFGNIAVLGLTPNV